MRLEIYTLVHVHCRIYVVSNRVEIVELSTPTRLYSECCVSKSATFYLLEFAHRHITSSGYGSPNRATLSKSQQQHHQKTVTHIKHNLLFKILNCYWLS
jgi:hypothetical protein